MTAQEIQIGILNEKEASEKCLAFFRDFINLPPDNECGTDAETLKYFVDSDEERINFLIGLKKKVEAVLPDENRRSLTVTATRLDLNIQATHFSSAFCL